jgi:hypothetical protein
MPEIKNTFTQGKMNKDLDERVIPNGQYRDAMNIKINTSDDSSVGTVQNILGNARVEDYVPANYLCIATISDEKSNKLYWFVTAKSATTHAILQYDLLEKQTKIVIVDTNNTVLKFTQNIITGINIIDNLLFWTDNYSEPKKINIDTCIEGSSGSDLDSAPHTKLMVEGIDKGFINESHITVIKKNPKIAPSITINEPTNKNTPKLFEQVFPRFSFRYKYKDGEYSSFGPFTDVIFNPIYNVDPLVMDYSKENAYSVKESYNTAMVNNIESIKISNFISSSTPKDVVQVEILYKEEGSSVVYSIKTIDYDDNEWDVNHNDYNTFTLKSETIFAAIPENQFLRPWDNVPKKALAQEITGNRLVYGNYMQNYNLLSSENFKVGNLINADYGIRQNKRSSDLGGLPSLKSQRNYQVGFVWGDKYGRETPVFTSEESGVNIPWFDKDYNPSASKSLYLKTNLNTYIPKWADYYKIYVKETSGDYYNLIMDKAYAQSNLNVFDRDEDRVWLSFPSADRNKVTEDDYLILKKEISGNHEQIKLENKFKILDIQNEAPDAIKFEYHKLGEANQNSDNAGTNAYLTGSLMTDSTYRIDQTTDMIYIHRSEWINTVGGGSLTKDGNNENMYIENLYLSFKDVVSGENSSKYKVISILFDASNYQVKLNRKITETDTKLAAHDSNTALLNPNLTLSFERKDKKDLDQFSGKFFVQIVSSPPSQSETTNEELLQNYIKSSQRKSNWFYDPAISSTGGTSLSGVPIDSDGVINVNLTITPPAETSALTSGSGSTRDPNHWDLLATELDDTSQRGFFIDNMYMVSGQILASSNAKLSGKTWMGWGENNPRIPTWTVINIDGDYGWTNTINPTQPAPLNSNYSPRPLSTGGSMQSEKDPTRAMNGLEGFLTTKSEHTGSSLSGLPGPEGYRRWKDSSSTPFIHPLHGFGDDTYGDIPVQGDLDQNERFFIHLSFLGPGKNLHDNTWTIAHADAELKGEDSVGNHMQGVWGGGLFTDPSTGVVVEMEGNYINGVAQSSTPGPEDGQGYDNSNDYKTKNEEQWNPAYPFDDPDSDKIKEFITNLAVGKKFVIGELETDSVVFEIIGDVKEKRIYNHTPWIAQYKWDGTNTNDPTVSNSGLVLTGESVDEAAIAWANDQGDSGKFDDFLEKIVDFGGKDNRRVVYIFEVDKNPASIPGVVDSSVDFDSQNKLDITFITNDPGVLLKDVIKNPAIWETEPKEKTGLDIYYEASQAYPIYLTDETNKLFAPIGSRVEILIDEARNGKHIISEEIYVKSWINNRQLVVTGGGFNVKDVNGGAIIYESAHIRFFRPDGSYTTTQLTGVPQPQTTDYVNIFDIDPTLDAAMEMGLSWYNCFSFGNGIESNRIRDDFNKPQIGNGVKASITLEQEYKEEHRKNGLIYSGIYNSTSGVNNLNQFIMAEKITKDLNPTYGSIQKLFQRRISLISFCEDRVVGITSNKDALYNADGNPQLISTNAVLGDASPFVGDFGISKNPESFAKESYRAYFTDKQRGAVLRLSMDGLTAISEAGMGDYFKDSFKQAGEMIGTYDNHSKNYNLTLGAKKPENNLIISSSISTGQSSTLLTNPEIIDDGNLNSIVPLVDAPDLDIVNNIINNSILTASITIINHDEILAGDLLDETTTTTTTGGTSTTFQVNDSEVFGTSDVNGSTLIGSNGVNPFGVGGSVGVGNADDAKYWFERNYVGNSFATGNVCVYPTDGSVYPPTACVSKTTRWWNGLGGYWGPSSDIFWQPTKTSYPGTYTDPNTGNSYQAQSGEPWFYDAPQFNNGVGIVFDGTSQNNQGGIFIPGQHQPNPTTGSTNNTLVPPLVIAEYNTAVDNTIFNGEEIEISFYGSSASIMSESTVSNNERYFTITLYDGSTAITNSQILDTGNTILTDPIYNSNNFTPTVSGHQLGFQQGSATVDFPDLINSTQQLHKVYFKFTDGTAAEGIVIQNLQVEIIMHDSDSGQTGDDARSYGNISSFQITKKYRLTDVFTSLTTTTTGNGDAIPTYDVPAWAEVSVGVDDWNLEDSYLDPSTGLDVITPANIVDYLVTTPTVYGLDHLQITVTETNDDAVSQSYIAPPNYDPATSGSGDVSNGYVNYDDSSGGTGMYVDDTYTQDDIFSFDGTNTSGNSRSFILTQSQSASTIEDNNWYVLDILYNNFSGTLPYIQNYPSAPAFEDITITDPSHPIYSVGTTLLRCIFEGDSSISDLKINFDQNTIVKCDDINLLDITTTFTGGIHQYNKWKLNTGTLNNPDPVTSFDLPRVYLDDQLGIYFDTTTNYCAVHQDITSLDTTTDGYELKFTVTARDYPTTPTILPVSGTLNFHVTNSVNGFYYNDITTEGHYTINGNFDASTYDITRTDLDGTNLNTITGGVTGFSMPTYTSQTNIINFNATDFQGCVDNISLVDLTNHFTAGSAGNFTFSGFDPSLNNYIDFDEFPAGSGEGRIIFVDAPIGSPAPVQIEQLVSKTIQNNDYYRVRFNHDITSGAINGYYFNANGKGFRFGTINNNAYYDVLHKVGDATIDLSSTTELLNTLVIYVEQDSTNGNIDNLLLRQEFPIFDATTVTFSEDVRGWTSFKSFIPEQGVSLSNEYFTMSNGGLFQHNAEADSNGDPVTRNTFYGHDLEPSTITAVLNESSSVVKSFNTLNYEGSQSEVLEHKQINIDGNDYTTLSTYNLNSKPGWSVEYLKTDKQEGTINEFIEKEGKWFNYIKGLSTDIKTSDLSFQGLGVVKTIQ